MGEYEPLTDPDLVTQKLKAALQKPAQLTDQILSENLRDVIFSRGGDDIELTPAPEVLLSLGYIRQIGQSPYGIVWLNNKQPDRGYEGYEIITGQGPAQLYLSDFEVDTQTVVSSTDKALRLRILQLVLDGHINTLIKPPQ